MFKYFTIIYFSIIATMVVAFIFKINPLIICGYAFIMPSLGVFYGIIRRWRFTKSDKLMYSIFVIGLLSDVTVYFGLGEIGVLAQIALTLATYVLYSSVFRKEGTYVVFSKKGDLPKFLIPFIPIFLFFGLEFFSLNNDKYYFMAMIYAMCEYLFILYALLRPVKLKSYRWVLFGVSLKIFSDIAYSYAVLIHLDYQFFYTINFIFYGTSQYFLLLGILISDAKALDNGSNRKLNVPFIFGNSKNETTENSTTIEAFIGLKLLR